MSLTLITVTGTFSEGRPCVGSVSFHLQQPIKNADGKVLIPAFKRSAPLNPDDGTFSIGLPASDDPDSSPSPMPYTITWRIGNTTNQYAALIPHTAPGGTVDLYDLTPVGDAPSAPGTVWATAADVVTEAALREAGDEAAIAAAIAAANDYTDAHGGGGGTGGTVSDATTSAKGIVQLAGDLGGTAAAPTVPGLAGKASTGALAAETTRATAAEAANAAAITAETTARTNADAAEVIARNAAIAAAVSGLINGAPGALDTLKELADAINDDASFAASVTTALAGKQPIDSDLTAIAALSTTAFGRAFLTMTDAAATKVVLALVKGDVGLGNVDNTSDANKPVSTAQAAADTAILVAAATDAATKASAAQAAAVALARPGNFVTKTANYTASVGDYVLCNATSGAFTVTLPSNPAVGALVAAKKTDATGNLPLVAPSGSGTIDGDPTATLGSRWAGAVFEHQGSDVWTVAAVTAVPNTGMVSESLLSPRVSAPKAKGAVCFTFDDGYSYYDSIRQLLNANGQRGTFYISSDYIDGGGAKITSAQLAQLAADGHEIGDHGKTHSNLTGVAASTLAAELDTSKATIEAIVGAGKVNAFAYPFGSTGRNTTLDLEVASRYFSARSVGNFVGDGQPMFLFRADRPGEITPLIAAYPWGTNYPGDSDNTRTHANVLNYIRLAAKHPVIFILLAHDPVAVGPPTDAQIREAINLAASLGVPALTISEAFGYATPVLDPGFEDTTMAAWIKQGTAGETANIVTDPALTGYYGSTSLHLNVANIANNVYVSQPVPVLPGRAYTFGGHARVAGLSAGSPGLVPRIRWKNFDGTTTINSINGTALTSANNGAGYAPISVTATAPVNAAYAQLDWLLNGVTGDAYVSHCFLQGNETGAFG